LPVDPEALPVDPEARPTRPGLFHLCADKLGNVYVADSGNNLIRMVSPAGKVTTFAGTGARGHEDEVVSGAASFNNPEGVAVDSAGNVYVADSGNSGGPEGTNLRACGLAQHGAMMAQLQ
jgi:DNA-binding beta-propeller fold protein YncE